MTPAPDKDTPHPMSQHLHTTVTVDNITWTTEQPTRQEKTAGVTNVHTTTYNGQPWRLLGWADPVDVPPPHVHVAVPSYSLQWALTRYGLDSTREYRMHPCSTMVALEWANDLLVHACSSNVVQRNEEGEYCGLGSDVRHNPARCPGYHS